MAISLAADLVASLVVPDLAADRAGPGLVRSGLAARLAGLEGDFVVFLTAGLACDFFAGPEIWLVWPEPGDGCYA